jgi:hypothetical protein
MQSFPQSASRLLSAATSTYLFFPVYLLGARLWLTQRLTGGLQNFESICLHEPFITSLLSNQLRLAFSKNYFLCLFSPGFLDTSLPAF